MPHATPATPAIVLGTGITALGVARVLSRAGVAAYSALAEPDHLRHSRYSRSLPGGAVPFRHGDDLGAWLAGLPLERAVLFPCSDGLVRAVAGLSREMRDRFPAVVPPLEVLDHVVDKAHLAAFLDAAGIPHPYSRVLEDRTSLQAVPEEVFGSAFLKPRESQAFFARFQVKGVPVVSRAEAEHRLAQLQAAGFAMILQEYIPGSAAAHIFVDGYADRSGAIRALFVRRRLRMYPPDFGNSTYMVSIEPGEAPGAEDTVRRLITALGYRGIFSVELKQDARDRVHKVIELNARAWWYVEFAARCGVDVCMLAYHDALGQALQDPAPYQPGTALMYPAYDFSAARLLRREGSLSMARWMVQALWASEPVFQWDDPWPGIREYAEWVAGAIRNRMGRRA